MAYTGLRADGSGMACMGLRLADVAERQTRWVQGPVEATPWRFKSSHPHQVSRGATGPPAGFDIERI